MRLLSVQFGWVVGVNESIKIELTTSDIVIKLRLDERLVPVH